MIGEIFTEDAAVLACRYLATQCHVISQLDTETAKARDLCPRYCPHKWDGSRVSPLWACSEVDEHVWADYFATFRYEPDEKGPVINNTPD